MEKLYELVWVLFVYGFLGWCAEVIFAACTKGEFVNRGFLCGPICPIYGFGVLIVTAVLEPVRQSWAALFAGSVLLTSLLELVTGFALERLLHEKWWDYSDVPLNLGGYICLKFSLVWGLACMFVVRTAHPFVLRLIRLVPLSVGRPAALLLLAVLAADFAVTRVGVLHLGRRFRRLGELEDALRTVSNALGGELAGRAISAKEANARLKAAVEAKRPDLRGLYARYQSLLSFHSYTHNRILRAFPRIQKGRYAGLIQKIKASQKEPHKDNGEISHDQSTADHKGSVSAAPGPGRK